MKRPLLLAMTLLMVTFCFAQIPNASFENWTTETDSTGIFEEPNSYHTTNNQRYFLPGPDFVTKTTDAYAGTYALQVKSDSTGAFGTTIPGEAVTGSRSGFSTKTQRLRLFRSGPSIPKRVFQVKPHGR